MTFLVLLILTVAITGGVFYLIVSRSKNSVPPSSGTGSGSSDSSDRTDELRIDVSSTRDREEL